MILHTIDIVLDRTDKTFLIDALDGETFCGYVDHLAIVHSIFFHRIFGNVVPLSRDVLDVTFVRRP
jgi:hypothetical protein